jgi:hypothetical protein
VPVYIILATTCGVALATLYGDPTLLYRLTREDGLVENITVLAMLLLAFMVGRRMVSPPAAMPKLHRLVAWALVAMALASAGEELSWGQRLFGFKTGQTMNAINLQHETNLHNLIPGQLFNGLIVFALGIGFVLIPTFWRRRPSAPLWLPSEEVSLLMLDAILINHYRFASLPEQAGIVVILLLLAGYTVAGVRRRDFGLLAGSLAGWLTAGCLHHCRAVLKAANHQYEIRELLIVVLATIWASQTLDAYVAAPQDGSDRSPRPPSTGS